MLGTTIAVLTTHRQTRRQVARALMSAGSTAYFAETLDELEQTVAQQNPDLLIFDADNGDAEVFERIMQAGPAGRPAPVILLSISPDKRPLAGLVDRYDISNLVAKHGAIRASYPVLDERELVVTCEKVLQRNIFGVEKYVGQWGIVLHRAQVTSVKEKGPFLTRFEDYLSALDCPRSVVPDIITVADELILNAIVHAPRDREGRPKYEDLSALPDLILEPHEYVNITYGCDGQRLMLSVVDNFGTLDREKLVGYLARAFGSQLTPEAKPSGAGIGLSISFRSIHQLIFNVQESRRTEAIAGWYLRVNSGAEFRQVEKSLNLFWLPAESRPALEDAQSTSMAVIYMPATIDESTDFGAGAQAVVLEMGAVKTVTDRGLAEWMKFVSSARGRNVVIHGYPEAMVRREAAPGALAGLKVKTVLAPFACASCGTKQELAVSPETVMQSPAERCSCGAAFAFAGRNAEYEGFLRALRGTDARV